jgi:hypothetical protein
MKKTAAVRHARTLRTIPLEDLGNVRGGDDAGTTKRPELAGYACGRGPCQSEALDPPLVAGMGSRRRAGPTCHSK